MMLATTTGGSLCQIELGESDDQWAQRDSYDGCHGDAGLSWLMYGYSRDSIEDKIIAWVEVLPAVPTVKP